MINGHGNNLHAYKGKIKYDFSSNIACNHKSAPILKHLETKLSCINNYPDPNVTELTDKIAAFHGVPAQQVLVTNGSAEAFYLLAHLYQQQHTLICIPAFAEYEDACKLYRHQLSFAALKDFPTVDLHPYKTVWLATPNNPDGYFTDKAAIRTVAAKYPDTTIILDEAYSGLCSGVHAASTENEPSNLISIHSLTKLFAIPGIRLGYIIADEAVIAQLHEMRPPWSVNALSQEAGVFIMDHYETLLPDFKELQVEVAFLVDAFAKLDGITIYPSSCNFFLCRLSKGTAADLKAFLIETHGILIRDASNFRGLDTHCFRVAVQSREANEALIVAMHDAQSKGLI
ncbi:MAG: aminotransferase class I/II-fold pyridoxal phosphate-dependent enzyme [Tannerellaceae bacterium]